MVRGESLRRHRKHWCSRSQGLPLLAPAPPGWSHLRDCKEIYCNERISDIWQDYSHGMILGFWFFSMLDFLAPCLREWVLFSFTALLNSTWWWQSFQFQKNQFGFVIRAGEWCTGQISRSGLLLLSGEWLRMSQWQCAAALFQAYSRSLSQRWVLFQAYKLKQTRCAQDYNCIAWCCWCFCCAVIL